MLNIAWLFLKGYWKEILIISFFVFIGLFVHSHFKLRDNLAKTEVVIENLKEEKDKLQKSLDDLDKISKEQRERLKAAEKERQEYLVKLVADINKIRMQTIPKDCQGAIDFAIKNKDDLKW